MVQSKARFECLIFKVSTFKLFGFVEFTSLSISLPPPFQSIPMFGSLSKAKHVFITISPTINTQLHSFRFLSTTSHSKDPSFTLSYLTHTCGFSPEQAASISKRVYLKTPEKPQLVIEFFKNLGLSQPQVLRIFKHAPALLSWDPEKTLKPKIEFLLSNGFSNPEISTILNKCPEILKRSLKNELIPCFDFFNNMFQSEHNFKKAVIRYSGILYGLGYCSASNMKLLKEEGVPESNIVRFVGYYPGSIKTPSRRFKEIVKEVQELGFDPLRFQFLAAIHVKCCIGRSTWARKEDIYKRWGWTDDDIQAAFRVQPNCMAISETKLEAAMDFLVNKLGCKSSAIARCPVVLGLSLEKRIIPRGSVFIALLSKGLVDKISLSKMFVCVEHVFLHRYIFCHEEEADELLKLYHDKLTLTG